jgi:hypothetical protein
MLSFRRLKTRNVALTCGGFLVGLALTSSDANAQHYHHQPPPCTPPIIIPDCAKPAMPIPPAVAPTAPPIAPPTTPPQPPATPPQPPTTPAQPPTTPQTPPAQAPQQQQQQASAADIGLGAPRESPVGGQFFAGGGYIDNAIPVSQFRMRFDAAYGNNRPDRAEFFYPKCGCFRTVALRNPAHPEGDLNAAGPPEGGETNVDYQELRSYLEIALDKRFSAFVEVPVRWINPDVNLNATGLGDVQFGFKYAFIYDCDMVVTAQVRANAPSGDPFLGLGTNNWALEPGILAFMKVSDDLFVEAEVRDYIPLNAQTDFAGNVLRYGIGASYLVYRTKSFRVGPVVELVGWTVLDGKELNEQAITIDATGTTIVNAKLGVRIGFGEVEDSPVLSRADMYIGYGRALTGPVWYEDMFRVEFRYRL